MKLDSETLKWIERAIGDMQHGEVILSICEKQIAKVVVVQHTLRGKRVDKPEAIG